MNARTLEWLHAIGQEDADRQGDPPSADPTLEQIRHVIQSMPATTEIEQRDRALIAFTILTGARDGAVASFKLRHIDIAQLAANKSITADNGAIDEYRYKLSQPHTNRTKP